MEIITAIFVFSVLFTYICCDYYRGWDGVTLRCRDNSNKPMDWWFIYTPPGDMPFSYEGRNFTYINSANPHRWTAAHTLITGRNSLSYSLRPIYKRTFRSHLAVVAYDDRPRKGKFGGTRAKGILMADENGGLWIQHTIPGIPDINGLRPMFPPDEMDHGHMAFCLSLDIASVNKIADVLRGIAPKFLFSRLPKEMIDYVQDWTFENKPKRQRRYLNNTAIKTRQGIRTIVYYRSPDLQSCIYRSFAKANGIVLDIYSPNNNISLHNYCNKKYGVRSIDQISLKLFNDVVYIVGEKDKSRFAVSTSAAWQRRGASTHAGYWTCLSDADRRDPARPATVLTCIDHYNIWHAFTNLKVAEPKCKR